VPVATLLGDGRYSTRPGRIELTIRTASDMATSRNGARSGSVIGHERLTAPVAAA
jgi:hypothetical protein